MAVQWVPDEPRTFNLGLRSRSVDHVAKTVTLQVASDEAILMDYATLIEDTGALALQGSIRSVVNYVLGKIGAALEPGGPDGPIHALSDSVNLVPNSRAAVDLTDWSNGGAPGTLGRWETGGPMFAPTYVSLASTADGPILIQYAPPTVSARPQVAVTPGKTYRVSADLYSPAGMPVSLDALVYNSAGVLLLDGPDAGAVLTLNWSRLSVTFTAPANAAYVVLRFFTIAAVPAGSYLNVTGVRVSEISADPSDTGYFAGDMAASSEYGYAFSGAPHASTSTRTALSSVTPDLLVWNVGVSGWDFLAPLVTTFGFRLFCDELRVWRLIDPALYYVPGVVPVNPGNATQGVDTISREDTDVFATGIVVRYLWTTADGAAHVATDTAGTPEKVVVLEYRRPWPGDGSAAKILSRRNGTGRTQDVSGIARWPATPGMEGTVTLPGALTQQGKVVDVTFSLGDDALMQVGIRGLVDILPGSIDGLIGTIDGLIGTIDGL
jgi:hypothetical protein